MKNMKNIILSLSFIVSLSVNAQIVQTEGSNTSGNSSMAFIDGSSAITYNPFNGAGKGILFPSTDLTNINAADVFDSGTVGTAAYNPNYYDGLVVYNTGTGAVTGEMGSGSPDVAPGFYYYANPTRTAWDGGTWTPMGGGGVTDTPTFEPATEMDVNLSDPLVTPVISTETATSVFTFVNTRDRESGDKTTQIMNLPPPTPVGKLIIINNSANSLNVQFNPSVGGNNVVAAYRGVMLVATADGWLNLSE